MRVVEGEVEELQCLEAIGMGCEQATEDVVDEGGGDGGRREVVEECWVEGLVWERVVVDDSCDCVYVGCGML